LLGQIGKFLARLLAFQIEFDLLLRFFKRMLFFAGQLDDVITKRGLYDGAGLTYF
jgi:hypothetical protein